MKYRILRRRPSRRRATSKKLQRVTTGEYKAQGRGRPVVLRASLARREAARASPSVVAESPAARARGPAPSEPAAGPDGFLERRFREVRVLEEDGARRVTEVLESGSRRRLLLQTVRAAGSANWDAWEALRREGEVLRSLQHQGLPEYVDHGEEDGALYLATVRLPGRSLQQRLERSERYTNVKLQHILASALGVLAYLHELNPPVFHCDLGPNSLHVSDEGQVWLTGFSRVRGVLSDAPSDAGMGAAYLAPERWTPAAGEAADLYALGATLVAVASGTDVALLPIREPAPGADTLIDVEACMRKTSLRDALARLVDPDPDQRIAAAATIRERWKPRR